MLRLGKNAQLRDSVTTKAKLWSHFHGPKLKRFVGFLSIFLVYNKFSSLCDSNMQKETERTKVQETVKLFR